MRPDLVELWNRIEAFDIDGEPAPALRFVDRLAKVNSWSLRFAKQAVREYKRFVFLTMTVGRPMCPSEQVDQVWHLHLTYTRSYWQRFCGEVLNCPLHHDPTRGGKAEGRKHWAMYLDTLLAYREAFDEEPAADLWPPPDQRFGNDVAITKINRNDYLLVPKPQVGRPTAIAVATMLAATLAIGCGGADNPFDLKGTDYLPFFFTVWGVALVVGLLVRRATCGPGLNSDDPVPELDEYEVAYLNGGRPRVLATAMVRLKERGHVDIGPGGQVIIHNGPFGVDRIEREVFDSLAQQVGNTLDPKPLMQAIKDLEDTRFARLRDEQLIPTSKAKLIGVAIPLTLCLAAVFLFGVTRMILGIAGNKPVGFLAFSLAAALMVSLTVFGRSLKRTRKADAVLANLSKRHARLRTLTSDLQPGDAGLAVAMFGVGVLGGTAYASMYDRMKKFDTTGAAGGCVSTGCSAAGCGGGGGGGGGCGGCGGGGGD
jgi:uncharacterized protein (TIGR04222 family)